jgi:hypothetical protein
MRIRIDEEEGVIVIVCGFGLKGKIQFGLIQWQSMKMSYV